MGRNALIIGAALAAMLATSASAAVTVLGNGAANQCSAAALAGDATDEDLAVCNQALLEVVSDVEKAGTYVNRGVILLRRKAFTAAPKRHLAVGFSTVKRLSSWRGASQLGASSRAFM